MSNKKPPVVLVFAGPNGSGKSTLTGAISLHGTYVNADDLKREYNLTDIEAAQQAEVLRNKLIENCSDFSFETVLSTDRNLLLLQRAKKNGYKVRCIYVITCNENINIARVRARYKAGGHDVPEDKIRLRYRKALKLLPQLIPICDEILIYDNSDVPMLIYRKQGLKSDLYPNEHWTETMLQELLNI